MLECASSDAITMPRMIDLIRASAVPANLVQSAAKGALSVPAPEMIEILVYLAVHNKVFAEKARMTLAGWDEISTREAASSPATPKEVLDYLIDPENLRPAVLPVLLENPAVSEAGILRVAAAASREQLDILLKSTRVMQSANLLGVLAASPSLKENEAKLIQEKLAALGVELADRSVPHAVHASASEAESADPDVSEETVAAYLTEHAAEIAAEAGKTFQAVTALIESTAEVAETAAIATSAHGGAAAKPALDKKQIPSAEEKRGSALQKISKLDIKGRIQLAMKGNKEERSLLVRDGTKIVALAVLESPKVTDAEVEKFASQKNVLEAVLRAIPMKRRFMKMYPVVRNLTFNPRTPIDVSLGLIKNLMIQDLRHLSGNKEVSETVRKLATKMFRQKLDTTKKS